MDIAKYALIKIGDMLTILLALLLLLATNTGFSVYLLVMRSDEANKVEVSTTFCCSFRNIWKRSLFLSKVPNNSLALNPFT